MEGHSQNVGCVAFHPELPIILSGSEDGTVKLWHSNTYRLESTLNYGLERCWAISCMKGSNNVALGYDEGAMMIKVRVASRAMETNARAFLVGSRGTGHVDGCVDGQNRLGETLRNPTGQSEATGQ